MAKRRYSNKPKTPPQGEKTGRQSSSHASPLLVSGATSERGLLACEAGTLTSDVLRRAGCAPGLVSYASALGYPLARGGTYAVYREMSRDPTFALAIAAANSPIMLASWSFEAKDGVPESYTGFIKEQLEPMRSHIVRECLRAREFGWRGMEKVWAVQEQANAGLPTLMTRLKKLKPLMPEKTTILIEKDTGVFAGFKNDKVTLEIERSFLYTHALDCDDYYGNALHNNGLRAWANWLNTIDNGYRLQRKISGTIVQLHYPIGTTTNTSGTEEDNSVVAQRILDGVAAGNSVAMPNDYYVVSNNPMLAADLAAKSKWVLSVLNAGSTAGDASSIDGQQRYWDVQKLRAWLVPERAATEGQYGTKAEAEAHADILLAVAEQEHQSIVRCVNWYVVDDLLSYNGVRRGDVYVTPEPIVDEKRAVLKAFLTALIANPGTLEMLLAGGDTFGDPVDVDAVLDQLGLPRTQAAREIVVKVVSDAQDNVIPPALQERIAGDYQPPDSNGNGKLIPSGAG